MSTAQGATTRAHFTLRAAAAEEGRLGEGTLPSVPTRRINACTTLTDGRADDHDHGAKRKGANGGGGGGAEGNGAFVRKENRQWCKHETGTRVRIMYCTVPE